MNIEAQVISAVCKNNDVAELMRENVIDMFMSHQDVAQGLINHYYKYKVVPNVETLADDFDFFEPESTTAPTSYYIDKMRNEFLQTRLRKAMIHASQTLSGDSAVAALEELNSSISELSRYSTIIKDVNLTDLKAAEEHYDSIRQHRHDNDGEVGIKTLLKAIDQSVPTGFAPGQLIIMLGYSARGKAEDVNKLIPTPSGYQRFGDLKPGDQVWDSNGRPTKVTQIHPQGIIDAYRVSFSDGTQGVFSGEHLWSFYSGRRGQKRQNLMTMTTIELVKRGLHHVGSNSQSRGSWKVLLPLPEPVQYGKKNLPIAPYLMGAMLGDGSYCSGDSVAMLTCNDEEIVDIIKQESPHQSIKEYPRTSVRRFAMHKLRRVFKDNDWERRGREKFIPEVYLTSTIEDRYAILRGLMDTDGHSPPKNYRPTFSTYSQQLADGVAELVRSLGGVAQLHYKLNRPEICVSIWTPLNPFAIKRKASNYSPREWFKAIAKVEKVEPTEMMCISVDADNHLYLTEDYTVTHNTWLSGYFAKQAFLQGKRPMIISMEMTAQAMRDRIYATLGDGKFSMADFQTGSIDPDDFRTWSKKAIANKQDFIIVSPDGIAEVTPSVIQGKIDQYKPDIVVVDYIQLMSDGVGGRNETEKIRNISKELKRIAMRNNIPVIAISAVTSDTLTVPDSPPMLEQVAWSRSIQYDADLAIAVHKYDDTNIVEVVCRKNRNGPDFCVYLEVDLSKGQIRESFDNAILNG